VLLCIADAVALLDMLHSMAQLVTVSESYVRPEFTTTGPLAIRQGSVDVIKILLLSTTVYIMNLTHR
jgi:DNA mismatch repair ATPase MutS